MSTMDRRMFLGKTAAMLGSVIAANAHGNPVASTRPVATRPVRLGAGDVISLGKTGIKTSRLAIGTGTDAGAEQRNLGIDGLVRLFRHGFDQGARWWDVADMYKTHPHVAAALKEMKRDQVTITSKTQAKDYSGVKADIERFRRETNTDFIDIVLLHCMTEPDWPDRMKGPMDALSEAKSKGHVRAVGCSCHGFEALQAAADCPWVEVDLARINPFAAVMDINRVDEVPLVQQTLRRMHRQGKAVYGMKILGAGTLKGGQIEQSLRSVLGQPYISGFVIGFSKTDQIDDIVRRIAAVQG